MLTWRIPDKFSTISATAVMTTSLAPVIKKSSNEAHTTVREINGHSFQTQNMLVKYAEFDPVEEKYITISNNFREMSTPRR